MVSNVDIIIYILNDFSDYTENLLWNHNVSMDPIALLTQILKYRHERLIETKRLLVERKSRAQWQK